MSDWFYRAVYALGYPAFGCSSSPVILHHDRLPRSGGFLIAPNHLSPYDIPCMMFATRGRVIDFVSITEMFRKPLVGWFFGNMGAFPLDRWHPDAPAVRLMLDRLKDGRTLLMFPEGGIRNGQTSLLAGGRFRTGVLRVAQLAGVPLVPCVILGTRAYGRPQSWLPLRQTVWAASFGHPILPAPGSDTAAPAAQECRLRQTYVELHDELRQALARRRKSLTADDFASPTRPT